VLFDCFEDGATVLGGAPFNVAWHLRAFGCEPLLVSRVGDDAEGRRIRDAMEQWGMSTAGLQQDPEHATGAVRVSLKDGEPSFDILEGRAFDYIAADAVPPCNPSLIYHGSLCARRPESAGALRGITRRYTAPVFMDVNLRPPWWDKKLVLECLDRAHWVKLNDNELDTLSDETGDLEQKAAALQRRHDLGRVIVTRGARGALIMDERGDVFEVAPPASGRVVDTVGAGDGFASVCILSLVHDWDVEITLSRAQAFASALVERRGATVHEPEFYDAFKMRWGLPT
jgi:fructokinase